MLRARGREPDAFRPLVARYDRRLLYYIGRILGRQADCEDVLQEVWIKVYLRINSLRAPEAFRVWLYKIAHDVAISHLRKRGITEASVVDDEAVEEIADKDTTNELELLDRAESVHVALKSMSLPHREVLTLRFLEDLDLAGISEVVGCTIGTVKSRLHYAKVAIRKRLEEMSHE